MSKKIKMKIPDICVDCFYNKTQAAKLLGISRITLRKYTAKGRIRSCIHEISGHEYYSGKELLRAWQKGLDAPISPQDKYTKFRVNNNGINVLLGLRNEEFCKRVEGFMSRRKRK